MIGNSVYSMGLLGGVKAGLSSMVGGEVAQVTQIVHEGRLQSFNRMLHEAQAHGGGRHHGRDERAPALPGERGVSERRLDDPSGGRGGHAAQAGQGLFSSSADGQELYCQIDAGYPPLKFSFGNVAYSIGVGGGIMGTLKRLGRGEIKEFICLQQHAAPLPPAPRRRGPAAGANAVIGIETTVMPFQGVP